MITGFDWVLNRQELLEWTHQDHVQILWVYGQPGCGKSFLYYKVLEYVEDNTAKPTVYFLFCEADRERSTASSLLRSWTFQLLALLWTFNRGSETLQRIKRQLACRTTLEATAGEVSRLLLSLLNAEDMPTCFLAVDALDECSDIQVLFYLLPKIPKRFKIFATSRELPDTPAFNQIERPEENIRTLEITPDLTQEDVDRYLHKAVNTLRTIDGKPLPDGLREMIIKRLSDSKGMFLYIRVMIEYIHTQTTIDDIKKCLYDLPPTLTQRYRRIVDEISLQEVPHRLLAHKTIFWALTADRPLAARELCAALAVRPAAIDDSLVYSDNRRQLGDDPKMLIYRVCGTLIRPRRDVGMVYPFHATVTQYLKVWAEGIGLVREVAGFYQLPPDLNSEGIAAAVCMRYLSSSVVTSLRDRALGDAESVNRILVSGVKELDFLRYAVTQWFVHARFIQEGDEFLLGIAERLLHERSPTREIIWRMYWFSELERSETAEGCPTEFSGLHMAAYFGLVQVVKRLLRNTRHYVRDGQGRTPLWRAAEKGYEQVVRVLRDAGAAMC